MRAEAVARLERGCGGYAGLAAASLGPPAALDQCCRQLIHAATAHTASRLNHTAFLGQAGVYHHGQREQLMTVAVCMHEVGMIWSANARGDILTACFFTTDEETEDELQRMGYQCLLTASPVAHLAAGTESDLTDLGECFLEACMRRGQGRQDDQRIITRASVRERR